MVATPTTNITFQNFFSTTLSADITDTATDIFLNAVPNGSEGFLVIEPDSTSNREIIYYTSKTALKVTVPSVADGRGQDDTTAHSHVTGSTVIMAPVAAYYEALLSLFQTTPAGWTSISGNISAVSYNGNRSYDLTTSSDNSAVISPGMRLRTTRTVSAPTQSASLNGSTQYFSKSSPAGMTFTDDFVVSAWIKLSSYSAAGIVTRYNGTSGWRLAIGSAGQVSLEGYNGGVGNVSYVLAYQAIPLNRWVHIAAQLDMSAFTATGTTSYIMIDGVDVPVQVVRGGTNPTALVQAGNLEIGGNNGGVNPFPGKIAQVAIYSAKVTQANIRATISQGLVGNETSLISAYSLSNSVNDLNANANNLTAQGSATTTNADAPWGGQASGSISATLDYAIIQAATSTNLTVQVPEGCTIPTGGGVSAVSYSNVKAPYGFPAARGKHQLLTVYKVARDLVSPASPTNFAGMQLQVPIGSWLVSADVTISIATATQPSGGHVLLSESSTGGINSTFPTEKFFYSDKLAGAYYDLQMVPWQYDPTTVKTVYLNGYRYDANVLNFTLNGNYRACYLTADNAYL